MSFEYITKYWTPGHRPKKQTPPSLERILAFRQLATCFLDSCNPPLKKHVIVLNCIVDYNGPLPPDRLRYFAHNFFREAERIIEHGGKPEDGINLPYAHWIQQWWKNDRSELPATT